MNVAFFSNFMNHHQLPFCRAMQRFCGGFHFVAAEPVPRHRLDLGYEDMNDLDFVVRAYERGNEARIETLLTDCDAVIFGAASEKYAPLRMARPKLSFYFTERFLKKGWWQKYKPSTRRRVRRMTSAFNGGPYHLLCAGAYVAADARFFGFRNRVYRWGYFPETEAHDIDRLITVKQAADPPRLLWAGGFVWWKHPQDAVHLAAALKRAGVDFHLEMVGAGKAEPALRRLTARYGLEDDVTLSGAVSPAQVREKMRGASIFLLTSDFHEGWGAVLNEALGSGCCAVASRAAGSAPTLIEHGENGILYDFGRRDEMIASVQRLLSDRALRERMARAAHATVAGLWNGEVAARRLTALCRGLLSGEPYRQPAAGPCSPALELWEYRTLASMLGVKA